MRVVKRYPNRKLYDTVVKQYISLDQIADFIRDGQDVYVVDNATGEDLTGLTLTQIIFEQEKKGSGFLPQAVLTGLIQAGGSTLNALRRTLTSSVDLLYQVDNEIERRVQVLINRGELAEDEGRRLSEKLVVRSSKGLCGQEPGPEDLQKALARRSVPTRSDFQRLAEQLDEVSSKLDSFAQGPTAPAPRYPSAARPSRPAADASSQPVEDTPPGGTND